MFDDFEDLTRETEEYIDLYYMVGHGEQEKACDRLLHMPSEEEPLYSTATIKLEGDECNQPLCPANHSCDYSRPKQFLSLPSPKKRTKKAAKKSLAKQEEQEDPVSSSPTFFAKLDSTNGKKSRKNLRQDERNEETVESSQKKVGQRLIKRAKRSAVRIKERRSVKRGVVESSEEEEDKDTGKGSSTKKASKRGKTASEKSKDSGKWGYIVEGIVEDAVRSVTKNIIGTNL